MKRDLLCNSTVVGGYVAPAIDLCVVSAERGFLGSQDFGDAGAAGGELGDGGSYDL